LNVYGVNDVRQTEMHTAEPLVPEHSFFKVEIAIEKMKISKLQCTNQILVELIQTAGNKLCSEIHQLINSVWIKELPQHWKESVIARIYKKCEKTDYSNYRGICYQLHTKFYPLVFS
jgi:hypothetical protein